MNPSGARVLPRVAARHGNLGYGIYPLRGKDCTDREEPVTTTPELPPLTTSDKARIALLFHFCRLQVPSVKIAEGPFASHLERSFRIFDLLL